MLKYILILCLCAVTPRVFGETRIAYVKDYCSINYRISNAFPAEAKSRVENAFKNFFKSKIEHEMIGLANLSPALYEKFKTKDPNGFSSFLNLYGLAEGQQPGEIYFGNGEIDDACGFHDKLVQFLDSLTQDGRYILEEINIPLRVFMKQSQNFPLIYNNFLKQIESDRNRLSRENSQILNDALNEIFVFNKFSY